MKTKMHVILMNVIPILSCVIMFISIFSPYWYHTETGYYPDQPLDEEIGDYGLLKVKYTQESTYQNETWIVTEESIPYSDWEERAMEDHGFSSDIVRCSYICFSIIILGVIIYVISLLIMNYCHIIKGDINERMKNKYYLITNPLGISLMLFGVLLFSIWFPSSVGYGSYPNTSLGTSWYLAIGALIILGIDGLIKYIIQRRSHGSSQFLR